MTYSMTGYGRCEQELHGRSITVEIKSVNSRYFEYSSRLPRNFSFVDDALKKAISAQVCRGKVEVHVSVVAVEAADYEVAPNLVLAKGYAAALAKIGEELGIENDVSVSVLARFSDLFTTHRSTGDEGELCADVLTVACDALERYNAMRALEGGKLQEDIETRLVRLAGLLAEVEAQTEGRAGRYAEKLHDRLKEILADTTVDESRMLTEAAIFADKTAVDEETVRLHSHIKQFGEILQGGGPVGRKLDFLTQEVNRETNTIGSKCQEVEITKLVIEMKAEIEKIREQIQNLE